MHKFYKLSLLLLLLAIAPGSFSEIYKWTDEEGNIRFSDRKPQQVNEVEEVKLKINTVKVPKVYGSSAEQQYATTENKAPGSNKKVIMYSASWCGVCKRAKKYFNNKGIRYQEYDVETSTKGRKDFKKLRARGVPVILVGKKRMDGFSEASFDKLYQG